MRLHDLVVDAAARAPGALAVRDSTESLTYGRLDRLADRYATALRARGVRPGDRVVLWTAKTVHAVALMQGCLRIGAIYVPVSGSNPVARVATIAESCSAALIVTDSGAGTPPGVRPECGIATLHDEFRRAGSDGSAVAHHRGSPDDPAYILYTSGSTGDPKGVCLSHTNALAFVRWACAELGLVPSDRLSNHAPFNFDLSVFDIYGAFHAGASVHLVDDEVAFAPEQLVRVLVERELTIWYSVPSALALMINKGGLLDGEPPAALRCCVFAGEPFAAEYVRRLRRAWPNVRLFNWYGPTETNVCTSYEVGPLEKVPRHTIPIGLACSDDAVELVPTPDGSGTELVVSGPTVMLGYWGGESPRGVYRTGDLARLDESGQLEYVGRRDHMAKVRGHRIELSEIEAVLAEIEAVSEVLVVVVGDGLDARLHAALVPTSEADSPNLLTLKRHCASRLPTYMLVDAVHVVAELPRTPNGKYDRAAVVTGIVNGSP